MNFSKQETQPVKSTQEITPLCVDLDGTLIYSDVLIESLLALIRKNFFFIFPVIFWLTKGKAFLKKKISDRINLEIKSLPYNKQLLIYLKGQHDLGRKLVLATATTYKYAKQIADHVGLFDLVLASDERVNLSGHAKSSKLTSIFGKKGFDYAGNSHTDLEVWQNSRHAIIVNAGIRLKSS